MMDKMEKLLEKKKKSGKELSPVEKDAKMGVIESMKKMAEDAMGDRLKKVTVASASKEGLQKGLAKAKEMVEGHGGTVGDSTASGLEDAVEGDEMGMHSDDRSKHVQGEEEMSSHMPEEGSEEEEASESPEQEASEDEDSEMSEDEINQKLEKLMALKKKMGK